jgi:hypothetical protein
MPAQVFAVPAGNLRLVSEGFLIHALVPRTCMNI